MKRASIYVRTDATPINRDRPRLELADSTHESVRRFVRKHQGDVFQTETLTEIFIVVDAREVLVFIQYEDVTILVPHWGLRKARQYVREYLEVA